MDEVTQGPEGWAVCTFEDLLAYIQPSKYIVESTEYSDSYKTPVLTPGKTFILGYTNEQHGIFDQLPAIIFDDFTTASKYVNFPFKVKSSAMKILVPSSELVNLKFIYYCMQSIKIRSDTHKRYWISVYAKKPLCIPSLNEQHRIVAKIEELFSELDQGVEGLKAAKAQLTVYRQAVLKAAFEGRLTEGWRKDHAGQLESVDKLLAKLKASNTISRNEGEIAHFRVDWRDAIPKEWSITSMESITVVNPNCDKSSIADDLNVSFVPMPSVGAANGQIDVTCSRPFKEVKKGFTAFLTGDVLFAKITPCMENGKMAVVPELINGYGFGSTEFHVLRPHNGVNVQFVYFFVSSEIFRADAERNMTGAVGQKRVPTTYVRLSEIPLPPTKEQEQIVQEIESRFSVVEKMEQAIEESLQKAEALRQSILKRAFEGKLVPQDPTDEPASTLLARIRAEREAATPVKKKRKVS